MKSFYVTFGQVHVHSVNGKTFDKNCVAEIEAESHEEAHNYAMKTFDKKFHNCHPESELERVIKYYPRGIIKVIN